MKDHLCDECGSHFTGLTETLEALKIDADVDGAIVRGLDYYTKTAFEITSADLGSQDALVGGGRYDLLVNELGGKSTPAVGFAAGMERLLMVMEKQASRENPLVAPEIFIAAADDEGRKWAFTATIAARRGGISAETDFLGRSVKSQMREADRQKSLFAIVVGKTEIDSGKGTLKNMRTGEETPVALESLVAEVARAVRVKET